MISYIIAHAYWDTRRHASLSRLMKSFDTKDCYIDVISSPFKEHASVWAHRVWEEAALRGLRNHSHVVILNDDVTVPEDFHQIVTAMVEAVPDEPISLHGSARALRGVPSPWDTRVCTLPAPWVRSYHYTGPGVILTPAMAGSLLEFSSRMPWSWVSRVNEDEVAALWAWERQQPFWVALPSPVTHDVTVPSTLGYDAQEERTSAVPWSEHQAELATMTDYWKVRNDPPHVDCSWNPPARLAHLQRLLRHSHVCVMCRVREGRVGKDGVMICEFCVEKCKELIK